MAAVLLQASVNQQVSVLNHKQALVVSNQPALVGSNQPVSLDSNQLDSEDNNRTISLPQMVKSHMIWIETKSRSLNSPSRTQSLTSNANRWDLDKSMLPSPAGMVRFSAIKPWPINSNKHQWFRHLLQIFNQLDSQFRHKDQYLACVGWLTLQASHQMLFCILLIQTVLSKDGTLNNNCLLKMLEITICQ